MIPHHRLKEEKHKERCCSGMEMQRSFQAIQAFLLFK